MKTLNKVVVLLILCVSFVFSTEFGDWKVEKGSNDSYRFAEQYGKTNDNKIQRLDFTYSRKNGWEMYFTTRLLTESEDKVILKVDDKVFSFQGQGSFHKQSFKLTEEIINLIKNTNKPIIIEEVYSGYDSYTITYSSKGSAASLIWVGDIK